MSGHHVMSVATNFKVFISLVILTILTVYTAKYVHIEGWNLIIAMFIASVKVTLVLLWFMHLKGDSTTNKVIIFSAVGFVALLAGICYSDLFYR